MNFNDFIAYMLKEVKRELGRDITVEVREVQKNNGIVLQGLTIFSKESNLSPTIYLNGFYTDYMEGKNVDEIRDSILEIYQRSKVNEKIDMDFFLDFSQVKDKLFCKLINYDMNTQLLSDVPYRKYLDLAVVCYLAYDEEHMGSGFITIHTGHLDQWGISAEELLEIAMANTKKARPSVFFSMEEMIRRMVESDVRGDLEREAVHSQDSEEWIEFTTDQVMKGLLGDRKRSNMYVMTNENKTWGAISLLWNDSLKHLADELESDLLILPSSVHEIIVVADEDQVSFEYLESMVRDINRTHVEPEEVLSDHVYRYVRESGTTILQ